MSILGEAAVLQAHLIRRVEERLLELFAEGRLSGTTHTCIGQEFSAVALGRHLAADDVVFSNHRCHGHFLAAVGDVEGLVAEVMGRQGGVCGGLGGSQHLHAGRFYSNGVQGGITPVAAGIALAQRKGIRPGLTVVCLGDGTLGEGVVYESLNLASLWKLPLVFYLENNLYAQSTAQWETLAGSIADRARAFGVEVFQGDTWDPETLDQTVAVALDFVRETQAPAFVQVDTYRLGAHSKGDDTRDPDEVANYRARDPLSRLLLDRQADSAWSAAARAVEERIEAAVGQAEADEDLDWPAPAGGEGPAELRRVQPQGGTQLEGINRGLRELLAGGPEVLLLGEDLRDPYGGAFKVTRGLSSDYPDRVLNTPISEAAIVGIANGFALAGGRAVAEIMFGDFLGLAFDQVLNHMAKFQAMYRRQVNLPVLVRTPMGGGRGYGPTHSQNLEKHFAGIPGLTVLVLHGRARVGAVYADLASQRSPVLMFENKLLYPVRDDRPLPAGGERLESDGRFPATVLRPAGPADLTLVAFGRMSELAEAVARRLHEEDEISVELVFPLQVSPLELAPILESARTTGKVLVVEEGAAGFDLGAEVLAALGTVWNEPRQLKMRRLAAHAAPLPSSARMEALALPSEAGIHAACLELFDA